MRASKLIFKGSRAYVGGRDVSIISTEPNQSSVQADSIDAEGSWVVVRCGDWTRAYYAGDVMEITPAIDAIEPERRGPGRPRGS
jgi:hypothetical protein